MKRLISCFLRLLLFMLSAALFLAIPGGASASLLPSGGSDDPVAVADFGESLTKGAGFKLSSPKGDFVDFRLRGAGPAAPLSLGKFTIFDLPGATIKYTRDGNKLKEDIVLPRRPVSNEIVFDYTSSGFFAEKTPEGGYTLLENGGTPVFEIAPPTVEDANGKAGKITLELSEGKAVLKIDPAFLDTAAYPVTVDPTIFNLPSGGVGLNSQRNTFFNTNYSRYWLFYVDTSANVIRYRYSTDGTTWTYSSYVPLASVTSGVYISTYANGTSVYVAYREGDSIKARMGTIRQDGSVSSIYWGGSSEATVLAGTSSSDSYTYPSISQATSSNKLWVVAKYTNGTSHRQKAVRSTNANDISVWDPKIDASAFVSSAYVVPQMLQLPSGHMYNVYLEGTAIKGRRWNNTNSSFDSAVPIASTYAADLNHIPSAVVYGSESIYVGYADGSRNLKYRTLANGYTGSWSGPQPLADSDTGTNVALTRQTGTAGLLYAFYASPPGASARVKQVIVTDPANKLNLSDTGDWDQIIAPAMTAAKSYAVWRKKNTDVWFSEPRVMPVTELEISPTSPNGEDGWYKSPTVPQITLTKSPTDTWAGVTTWYRWGSTGGFTQYTGVLTAPQGDKTLYYYSKDNVNNQESTASTSVKVDTVAPTNPTMTSPSHTTDTTSYDNTVDINLSGASDGVTGSGLDGYSIEWSQFATTTPDTTKDLGAATTSTVSPTLAGGAWYFHLKTKDIAGNWSSTVHLGPFNMAAELGLEGYTPTYSKGTNAANLTVNLANGNLLAQTVAPARPARGPDVAIAHTYNSLGSDDGDFGYGWTINYARRLDTADPSTSVTYFDEDGSRHLFTYDSTAAAYVRPPGVFMALNREGDGTFTLKDKSQVSSKFNSSGKLTSVADRNGNTVDLAYSAGKLVTITDASGGETALDYAGGRLSQVTTPDGRTNEFSYDGSGDLVGIKNAADTTSSVFTYLGHRMTGATDALGRTTTVSYENNLAASITDPTPLSHETAFYYAGPATVVDGPRTDVNDAVVYSIDQSGLLLALTEPAPGGTTAYLYDDDWNRTVVVRPNSAVTLSDYDDDGNMLSSTDASGAVTGYAYNAMNDIISATDALDRATLYSYDSTGNLDQVTDALDNAETYLYDAFGQRASSTNKRGYTTSYAYNNLGLETTVTDPLGNVTARGYDAAGNQITETNALGRQTSYVYDVLGRVISQIDPLGNTTSSSYDAVGNRTSVTNARGKITTSQYDQLNRLIVETKPTSATASWQYDEAGNKIVETNPNGASTTFVYDALNRPIQTIDALESSTTVTYDNVGNKTAETDQKGAETTYAVDAVGRIIAKTDALGKTTTFEYDALGKKTRETNARGASTWFGYDALGRTTVTTDALSHNTEYLYDAAGNRIEVTDARRNTTYSAFDANNRTISTTDALGYAATVEYDAAGKKISETNQLGHTTSYVYDAAGRLTSKSEENGPATYFSYDETGNKISESRSVDLPLADMESDEVWSGADADTVNKKQANQALKLTAADGATVSAAKTIALDWQNNYYSTTSTGSFQAWLYLDDASALDTSATKENDIILDSTGADLSNHYSASLNGLSLQTGWNLVQIPRGSFDASGSPDFSNITRLMFKITAKSGKTVNASFDDAKIAGAAKKTASNTYDDLDRVMTETDSRGATTAYSYDAAGNKTAVIDPAGKVTTVEYDLMNREISTTDPMDNTTSKVYDAAGNVVSQTDAELEETTYEYEAVGRQTKVIDPLLKPTTSVYDSVGNKTKEIKSDDTSVTYSFDLANRMTSMTNELGQSTAYTLDEVGNQTGITPPAGATTTNVYDDNNRLASTTSGEQTTTYQYDAAGNMTSETKPGDKVTTINYNALGQTTSTVDPDNNTTGFTYDIRGDLLSKMEPNFSTWYTYDEMGELIKTVDSAGRIKGQANNTKGNAVRVTDINGTVDFGYDDNDLVSSLKVLGETSTAFSYDANSAKIGYNQSNGVHTAYAYDDAGKPTSIETSTSGGTKLLDYSYQYGDESNIATETISGQTQRYKYDPADQFIGWTDASSDETTYAYDAAGNRVGVKHGSDPTVVSTYDAATNQLLSVTDGTGTRDFDYDASGNLVSVFQGSETTTYTWVADNRLASLSSSSTSASFTYDAEGNRLSKTINGTTTKFVYDDTHLIAEKDASGAVTAQYIYDDSGQLISMKKGGDTYYFHLNHRGDVITITDASEAVVATYSYDPWGNILSSNETSVTQPFRYASYYWDGEIGMYYLINRYYDPAIGRFISKDPAEKYQGGGESPEESNPYAYCSNNPIIETDANGLYPVSLLGDLRKIYNSAVAARYTFAPALNPDTNGVFNALWQYQKWNVDTQGKKLDMDGIYGSLTKGRLAYALAHGNQVKTIELVIPASPPGRVQNIAGIDQNPQTNWCWAAVGAMVVKHFAGTGLDDRDSKWDIAYAHQNNTENRTITNVQALNTLLNYYLGGKGKYRGGILSRTALKYQISGNYPVIAGWAQEGVAGTRHVVLITGYNVATRNVRFIDPNGGRVFNRRYNWFRRHTTPLGNIAVWNDSIFYR